MDPNSTDKIIAAAANLTRAVESVSLVGLEHVSSQVTSNQHLATSNQHLAEVTSVLESVGFKVEDGNSALLNAVKTLTDECKTLQQTVQEEGKAAREADKKRSIEFGFNAVANHTSLVPYRCSFYDHSKPHRWGQQLSEIGKLSEILWSFRSGLEHDVSKYFIPDGHPAFSERERADINTNFQTSLSNAIHNLTGQTPRFVHQDDGKVFIHYS